MKRLLTIGIALITLVAGMHVTIAGHYCGGKLAAIRISLSGKSASCGMKEHNPPEKENGTSIIPFCCFNDFTTYRVDPDYIPSEVQQSKTDWNPFPFHIAVADLAAVSNIPVSSQKTPVGPPGNYAANTVNRTVLCVFRI
jgi:hypothetical protein